MLPTFIVVGAKKAGTTSLHRYLQDHPDVWLPAAKRTSFFSTERWDLGADWYEAQFEPGRHHRARGEICTSYTRYPIVDGVPYRMRQIVPDVRLVYLVRHPIERLVSHYRHALIEGWERRPIDEAVLANPAEFVARSRYHLQIERYLEHFPRDQLLVITSEALRDERLATLGAVFEHLGVDPRHRPTTLDVSFNRTDDMRSEGPMVQRLRRSSPYLAIRERLPSRLRDRGWALTTRIPTFADDRFELSPDVRSILVERLRPDVQALSELLGEGFDGWDL